MNILPNELQTFTYYENLTPMYLKNVHGFLDQIGIWFDIFMKKGFETTCSSSTLCGRNVIGRNASSMVYSIDKMFGLLDIFNKASSINSASCSDLLDKLAALFGIRRQFSITINDEKKQISLNNEDLLIFIKCQIIKNFFDGSREHLVKCFELINLPIVPLTKQNDSAHCVMYMLLEDDEQVSQNIKDMFLAGLISVESMGIHYSYAIQIAEAIALFDRQTENSSFDVGQFII